MRGGEATRRGDQAPAPRDRPVSLGTATGIGSLGHTDRAAAVAMVLHHLPELPAAPSLPHLDPREGMLAQAGWGMAGVRVEADGSLRVETSLLDPEAPLGDAQLRGAPFVSLLAFLDAVPGRTGPVKVQMTGPFTLGRALVVAGAPPDVAFAAAGEAVRGRAAALVAAVRARAPDAPLVAFLDEPALAGGVPPELALEPDALVDLVSSALAALEPHATTGIHCCGPADWRAVLASGPEILSLPVGAATETSAGALAGFLERDGWIAWGAVPTDGPIGDSSSRWWRELSTLWCDLVRAGCDPVRLRHQALITPACGLAGHDPQQSAHVLDLTREVAHRLRDQVSGVRLLVGA